MSAVIIGASGGIGRALTLALSHNSKFGTIHAFSRREVRDWPAGVVPGHIDILDEATIKAAANQVAKAGHPELVIVASGLLSEGDTQPEKSWRHQGLDSYRRVFDINTFGPALIAKHFLSIMPNDRRAVFAAVSARVGSISDNRLGGWHAYRASKAALNMLIRNFAIEWRRKNDQSICVGLHPGTVDTDLSKPFQANVPGKQLFSAEQSAGYLLGVVDRLTPEDTGKVFDWAGKEVPA
ncbi:SDR family NAD(P)-dependent oxidoreductase [Henriciella sp. AS95]|uniref:SDR family NAD(P)-dependent oxidoreductase n=1 Tax=Henriciella sp. AS95 TaxID=3135782 RepID=UPI00318104D9